MAEKEADTNDASHRLPLEAAPKRLELRLAPLQLSLEGSLHMPYEAAPIRQREHMLKAQAAVAMAPSTLMAEEPEAVEEIHHIASHDTRPKDEVEDLETLQEATIKAEKALGADKDSRPPERLRQLPRTSQVKIFTKFRGVGHWSNKRVFVALIISLSLSLVGSLSVVGLLQSIESVNSDSLFVRHASELEWRPVQAGGSECTFYIKNNGDKAVTLGFFTENWDPPEASEYIGLSWDYDWRPVEPGNVVEVTFTLVDSSNIGIENFSFDIVFISSG